MNDIENVRAYAKCCLKADHGGFKRNSRLISQRKVVQI